MASQPEVGTLVPCSECVKDAHWAKCVECDGAMFVKHASIYCPNRDTEHDGHRIINIEPNTRRQSQPVDNTTRYGWSES